MVESVFLFVGFASWSIAAIRRRARGRIFGWLGFWSAMYGALQLSQSPDQLSAALLSQVDRWRPGATPQQDDMTLVVIDVA